MHGDCIAGGRFAGAAYRGGCGVDLEGGGLGEDCLCCGGEGEEEGEGEGEEHFVGWLVGWVVARAVLVGRQVRYLVSWTVISD